MQGVMLKFYFDEFKKEGPTPLYEYLLKLAHSMEIPGVTVTKGIAGYGRVGKIHEEHFWELGSNVPIEVSILTQKEKAAELIMKLGELSINVTYSITDCDWGHTQNI